MVTAGHFPMAKPKRPMRIRNSAERLARENAEGGRFEKVRRRHTGRGASRKSGGALPPPHPL